MGHGARFTGAPDPSVIVTATSSAWPLYPDHAGQALDLLFGGGDTGRVVVTV